MTKNEVKKILFRKDGLMFRATDDGIVLTNAQILFYNCVGNGAYKGKTIYDCLDLHMDKLPKDQKKGLVYENNEPWERVFPDIWQVVPTIPPRDDGGLDWADWHDVEFTKYSKDMKNDSDLYGRIFKRSDGEVGLISENYYRLLRDFYLENYTLIIKQNGSAQTSPILINFKGEDVPLDEKGQFILVMPMRQIDGEVIGELRDITGSKPKVADSERLDKTDKIQDAREENVKSKVTDLAVERLHRSVDSCDPETFIEDVKNSSSILDD